jgi:phospholipase/carboxylesterase
MLALELMFHLPGLAGIVGYSGGFYGPTDPSFKGPYPPVFLAHGTHDQVVPYVQMSLAENELTSLGVNVQTLTCPGVMHGIDIQGLQQGLTFLQQVFSSPSSVVELNKKNNHL